MTIKQQGGIFGRNPTFNDVDVEGSLTVDGSALPSVDNIAVLDTAQTFTEKQTLSKAGATFDIFNFEYTGAGDRITMGLDGYNSIMKLFSSNGSQSIQLSSGGANNSFFKGVDVEIHNANLVMATAGQGILCGVTSTDRNAVVRADLSQGVVGSAVYISRSGGSTAKSQIEFANSNGVVGSITTSGSATAYNTSSDYRLKTDAQPMTGASDRVKSLSPVNFEWISDGTRVDGFLAHEVQEIVPEAVHGAKDAMREEEYEVTPAVLDEEGNIVTEAVIGTRQVPDYQAIDQSKLVPLLTAALQEALAKIEQLEGRVASLEV